MTALTSNRLRSLPVSSWTFSPLKKPTSFSWWLFSAAVEGELPANLPVAYILHNCKRGVYMYENGVRKLDGQTPLPYATKITNEYNTGITRIDGNYGGNYVSRHVKFVAPGTKFTESFHRKIHMNYC